MENLRKKYKKVDFESHFYDQSLLDALQSRSVPPYYRGETKTISWTSAINMPQVKRMANLLDLCEARLAMMDQQGIATSVISSTAGPEILDDEDSIRVCKTTNDTVFHAAQQHPGRFFGSAILPVNNTDAACFELERCIKELGFVAWHTHTNYGKTAPEDTRYWPIFKKAAELKAYVYLHPHVPESPRLDDYGYILAAAGLGFTVDAMITTTRMIISGLFDEIPDLTVLLGHLGETFPFLLERMDNRMSGVGIPFPQSKHTKPPSYYFKNNILITTSGNASEAAFGCAQKALGNDRILFGSDYPYEVVEDSVEFLDNLSISEEEKEQVYWKNALDKLNISC